jgi:hypothetical protein
MKAMLVSAVTMCCVVAQVVLCAAADPPKTGGNRDTLIYARTDPPGAKVFVNGKEVGMTPGLFPADAGVATIILQLEGHGQVKKEIRIPANGITRIEIELKPQTPPAGHTAGAAVPSPSDPEAALRTMAPLKAAATAAFNAIEKGDAKTALAIADDLMPRAEQWLVQFKDSIPQPAARAAMDNAKALRAALQEGNLEEAQLRIRTIGEAGARIEAEIRQKAGRRAVERRPAGNDQSGTRGGPGSVPRIVETSPRIGADDVDPATNEIRVTFSEPMGGGFSWTGGGPDYPPTTGSAHWTEDRKTCILPVKLEAGHYYRVGINSTSFQNFRSAAGVPARPSAIYFTTKGANDEMKARLQKPQIVAISPANGAKDVDPATTELRVTFNVPMAGGFSWTGSGPNHPEVTGRPFWTADGKTCVLPVKLKPNWDYMLGLNSPSHKNFQSESGIPLEPVRYRFSTRAAAKTRDDGGTGTSISLPNPRQAASFVLDLAGRRLVALPRYADGKFLDPSKLTKSDKGDMFYYEREFSCLRGGTAKQWDDAGKRFVLLPPRNNGRNKTLTEYPLPSVPGRLLITTAEGTHYDVSVLSLTKEGTLSLEYRLADPELVKKSSAAPTDRREAFLPNVHDSTKGVAVILDLATGQMLSDPRDDKGYKQFDKGGKGDLTLDEGLICLRGARAERWDGKQSGDLLILTAGNGDRQSREYKLPELPCRLLITTAENRRFDVTVFFYADDNDGAYLEYKELRPTDAQRTASERPIKNGNLIATLVAANAKATALEIMHTAALRIDEPESIAPIVPSKPADAFAGASSRTLAATPAPRIVSVSPRVGADDVDPATSEIVVTFSQKMAGGFSWTGGGPDYPPIPEGMKPFWRNDRTCVLPVKLEEGRYYRVGINSKSYQNFRSAAGVPVRPSAVYFVTKGASDEVKSRLQKPRVVTISPANGAKDVDPATTELRVTFNVPMGGGCSWTGGGPNFPKATGQSNWTEDRKTCILPVELQPGWNYQLGLNSPSHNNFQSESGIPLEPVRYRFATRGHAAK